jgi:hypothetical protein
MQRISLALAAALSVAALAAHAESPDPSGQFAAGHGAVSRAQVQAELVQYKQAGVNPWSTQYNPLKTFRSEKTRAQVEAEFLADRQAVQALTSEDSGSAYLAAHRGTTAADNQFAGQPARNAQ